MVQQRARRDTRHSYDPILRQLLTRSCTSLLALLATSTSALAVCTVSANVATCTGDLSAGVDYFNQNLSSVGISNLTGPIGGAGVSVFDESASGADGTGQPGTSGVNTALTVNAAGQTVSTTNSAAVSMIKLAGSGASGVGPTSPGGTTGENGGAGGTGGNATIVVTGQVSASAAAGGPGGQAIFAYSMGGSGGAGEIQPEPMSTSDTLTGGVAGDGGAGGNVALTFADRLTFSGPGQAISVTSQGADANDQSQMYGNGSVIGGNGGRGGDGGSATLTLGDGSGLAYLILSGGVSQGVQALSLGGAGGSGMSAASTGAATGGYGAQGGVGGDGGAGGTVVVTGAIALFTTVTAPFIAVDAESIGGAGGTGGSAYSQTFTVGGVGGVGGSGGSVSVGTVDTPFLASISVAGDGGAGILARSAGAPGGNGGQESGGGAVAESGAALGSGNGGAVAVNLEGYVVTDGARAVAVLAQSVGGSGPIGSGYAASAASAGAGGAVTVALSLLDAGPGTPALFTQGDNSGALVAQSIGGGGGYALADVPGLGSMGSTGLAGGNAGQVSVSVSGESSVETLGSHSDAIYAESLGGGGGDAGSNYTVTQLGGGVSDQAAAGGAGGTGGAVGVTVDVNVQTKGDYSSGIVALSQGGGGGSAFSTTGIGIFGALGGVQAGGNGNDGNTVTVDFTGSVSTGGAASTGVFAQSLGGGGGKGSSVVSTGLGFSQAIGGQGGNGGNGDTVTVTQDPGSTGLIYTSGALSRGVVAQSIGGGGGDGGSASANADGFLTFTHTVGGSGGNGGDAGAVNVTLFDSIQTTGTQSAGIVAQSEGGGGGSAGSTLSFTNDASGLTLQQTVGGSGGNGGNGADVSVTTSGAIATVGDQSDGISAHSDGGGGGSSNIVMAASKGGLAALKIAVGGSGGDGGNAGMATVLATGAIETVGAGSDGVSAASTGGGGGNASTVLNVATLQMGTFNITVGSNGGKGGNASDVSATTGAVTTLGDSAVGVSAISTGGGGGRGSATLGGSAITTGDFNLTVGGSGGNGNSAGTATVVANGDISTRGNNADAIVASSNGGSGGMAGGSFSAATINTLDAGSVNLTLGGDGGNGGTAAAVSVTTAGDVTTAGLQSIGILAQSLGGGGGRVAGSGTANIVDIANASINLGGSGGTGGNAGAVSVTTATGQVISTAGIQSTGILAQSLGGQGGAGGFAADVSVDVNPAGEAGAAGQIGITVGGAGGGGGTSGAVTVKNASAVTTGDLKSDAILAQSIGGSGGAGGGAYAGNLSIGTSKNPNLTVTVGGDGGDGATSGVVVVTNDGNLATGGAWSNGIFAQSVGGNGGAGGQSLSVLGEVGTSIDSVIEIAVGGSGGTGAVAKAVTVTNTGTISTAKGGSDGIVAQSIGGNGGRGGSAGNLGIDLTKPPIGPASPNASFNLAINIGVGGSGGDGAKADTVTVNNSGAIVTHGAGSQGIFAQSVGGGGGDGGTSSATAFSTGDICNLDAFNYVCNTGGGNTEDINLSANIQIGGSGGTGGDGAAVSVTNTADITTNGQVSDAIFAQSVGGGGGTGGSGTMGMDAFTSNKVASNVSNAWSDFLPSFSSANIIIGGGAGAAGNGDKVTVTNSGMLTVNGPLLSLIGAGYQVPTGMTAPLEIEAGGYGIFAQSVGGGGGVGGAGSSGLAGTITIGQAGGSAGNGGDVLVDNTGAIVNASGMAGIGIFAQSVGGGGGAAGDVSLGWTSAWGHLNIGVGLGIQGNGGLGGDGGAVTVDSYAPITTTGQASHGIIAQSVGGSGGLAGLTTQSGATSVLVGSAGSPGNGGDVTVDVTAPIVTSGTNAVGIAAQSASGQPDSSSQNCGTDPTGPGCSENKSGTVTVSVGADVVAAGTGGRGLLLSSASYQNANTGDVLVTVAAGATVSTGADGQETVGIQTGGAGSKITNNGSIISGNPTSYAIRVNTPNAFEIDNNGVLTGQVDVESTDVANGAYLFNNNSGGTFNLGSFITLLTPGPASTATSGGASVFANTGTLSPGGAGVIQTSTVQVNTANLNAGGTLAPDFDPSQAVGGGRVAGDTLNISANVLTVAGTTVVPKVTIANPGQVATSGTVNIFESNLTFASGTFSVANTASVTYALSTVQALPGTQLLLSYTINTQALAGLAGATTARPTPTNLSFGAYLDRLINTPVSDPATAQFIGALGSYMLNQPTVDALLAAYDGFVGDELLAVPDATLTSNLAFTGDLRACPATGGGAGLIGASNGSSCSWVRFHGWSMQRNGSGGGVSYREGMGGLSAGMQADGGEGWSFGGALGMEQGTTTLDTGAGDVSRYFAGLTAARDMGVLHMTAAISGGVFRASMHRGLTLPGGAAATASSDPHGHILSAHLGFDRLFEGAGSYVHPGIDLGITRIVQDSFTETGAGGYGLTAGGLRQTFVSVNPYVELGRTFGQGATPWAGNLKLGLIGLIGPNPSIDAAFSGAGASTSTFRVENNQPNLFLQLGGGLDFRLSEAATLRINLDALVARGESRLGGGLRLDYRF